MADERSEFIKFNDNHDELGRFSSGDGGGSSSSGGGSGGGGSGNINAAMGSRDRLTALHAQGRHERVVQEAFSATGEFAHGGDVPHEHEAENEMIHNQVRSMVGARDFGRATGDNERFKGASDYLLGHIVARGNKSLDPDMLVWMGGAVKVLGDAVDGLTPVGGYLITFGDENHTDQSPLKDYFTPETDYDMEFPGKSTTYYNHGGNKTIGLKTFLPAELTADEFGIFQKSFLDERRNYEKFLADQARAGKLALSSGVPPHLIKREKQPNGSNKVLRWPLGKDASYTPAPAEYRNGLVSLKSLFTSDQAALPIEEDFIQVESTKGLTNMNDTELQAAIEAAFAKRDAAEKEQATKALELKTAEEAGYKKALDEMKRKGYLKGVPAYVPADNRGDDNDGVGAFKSWMKTGVPNEGLIVPDNSWMHGATLAMDPSGTKAAFNVTTGASGGYMVPDPLYQQIIAKRNLASWPRLAGIQSFQSSADHLLVTVEDTSHTAFVLTAEAAAYNEDEGTVAQVDMIKHKYTKETRESEEFVTFEGTNFDAWLTECLARAVRITENSLATTAVLASAVAATAASSQTALTIPEVTRLEGTLPGGYAIDGEMFWLMKRSTQFYIKGLAFASYQVFAQDGKFDGQPVYIDDNMPAMTQGLRSTLFGNARFMGVIEQPGIMVQRNPWLYMASGKIGIFSTIYRGFYVLQAEAFYTMAQAS
jgi:HK97 family phage major capsid protein